MKMSSDLKKIGLTTAGVLAGGIAIKKLNKPYVPMVVLGMGILIHMKIKNDIARDFATGLATVGAVGTIGKIAEKIERTKGVFPTINGMGELIQDSEGNIYEVNGLNGQPQLVQDENGNTYMVEGLSGGELDELVGYDDYEEVDGLTGAQLTELV